MKIQCQVTGLQLTLQAFGQTTMRALHPVCSMPLPALNKLASQTDTTPADDSLLLRAYLFQSGLVKFSAPILCTQLTPEFVTQQLAAVLHIANAGAKAHKTLPNLHIQKRDGAYSGTAQLSLKSWIAECTEILEHGRGATRADANQEFRAIRRATATRSRAAAVQFAEVLQWGFEYLSKLADYGRCTDAQVLGAASELELERVKNTERRIAFARLSAACATPCTAPLSDLKELRALCLETLPERDDNQCARKDAIISRINANLLLRAEFFAAIGGADDETMSIVESIATNYTIVTDSGSSINSAKPAAQSLVNLLAGVESMGNADMTTAHTITPSAEPLPQNFSSRLAYVLARKAWDAANGSNN